MTGTGIHRPLYTTRLSGYYGRRIQPCNIVNLYSKGTTCRNGRGLHWAQPKLDPPKSIQNAVSELMCSSIFFACQFTATLLLLRSFRCNGISIKSRFHSTLYVQCEREFVFSQFTIDTSNHGQPVFNSYSSSGGSTSWFRSSAD